HNIPFVNGFAVAELVFIVNDGDVAKQFN
ncbi:hypothetical protein LCGC14_3110810, partial [marine sediment metagenome]